MHNRILAAVVVAFGALSASTAFAQNMKLTSTEVADGSTIKEAQVANVFGCKGGNASPSLSWSGAPSDTKSFAITVYDPDAPTGSGFWHWVVFNIPPSTTEIPKGAGDVKKKLMPKGATRDVVQACLRNFLDIRCRWDTMWISKLRPFADADADPSVDYLFDWRPERCPPHGSW